MKIIPFLFLTIAFLVPVHAANRITATLTVTNAPTTNGQTITINGDVRTWYASVTNPATQILTNATVNGIATNLYNHLLSTPPSRVTPFMTGAAVLRLDAQTGAPLIISGVTNYFSVTYSTQTVSSAYDVVVPYTVVPSATRPTISAGLVDWLNLTTAKALFENSGSVSNLVGRTNSQTISGAKTFTGSLSISNKSGVQDVGTVISSNLVASGPLRSGTFTNTGIARIEGDLAVIGSLNVDGVEATGTVFTHDIFQGNGSGITNLQAGYLTGTIPYSVPATHIAPIGTNDFAAGADIAFASYNLATLTTGNNAAVPVGTNVFIEISGPGAAFAINGINASPNRDGKFIILYNKSGFNMSIAHQSGVDPVNSNRIISLTGADQATTADGAAILIYSGIAARWILISLSP